MSRQGATHIDKGVRMVRLDASAETTGDSLVTGGARRCSAGWLWRGVVVFGVVVAVSVCIVGVAGGFARAHVAVASSRASLPVAAVSAGARARLAARERWLASPGASAQRAVSQLAFHGLSGSASQRLLRRDYGSVLAGVSANPAASVARSGRLVRYLSNYRAVVSTPHGLVEETSTVPLRVADGRGGQAPVDLRLRSRGGSFAPAAPLVKVDVARNLRGGVVVGKEGLRFTLQGAEVAGSLSGGQDVFFGMWGWIWTLRSRRRSLGRICR